MKRSAKDKVYKYVYSKILDGSLPLGARLTEVGLASELEVSRTPVREALAQLVYEGLAVNVPGEGIFLRESNQHDLEELFQMRTIYEVFAVREAASHITPHLLHKLSEAVDFFRELAIEIRNGKSRHDEERCRDVCEAEINFHFSIIKATQNSRLIRSYSDTVLLVQTICCYDMKSMLTFSEVVYNYYQHRRIYEVIRKGNPDKAELFIRKHLQIGLDAALKLYDIKYPEQPESERASVWMEAFR